MTAADVLRTGALGLRTRRARAALCPRSGSRSASPRWSRCSASRSPRRPTCWPQLDRLGTNLLRVAPGQSFLGDESVLPESAAAMLRRVAGVESVAATRRR